MNLTTIKATLAGLPKVKTVLTGLGIAAIVTLGAALMTIGPTTDLTTWARNLGISEAGAVGGYLVATFKVDS